MLNRPALHGNWNTLSLTRRALKDKFPTPTVPLITVLPNRQVFLPDPVYTKKKRIVRQVGCLKELNRDAQSTEHKKETVSVKTFPEFCWKPKVHCCLLVIIMNFFYIDLTNILQLKLLLFVQCSVWNVTQSCSLKGSAIYADFGGWVRSVKTF
jgi:hypothetical protein